MPAPYRNLTISVPSTNSTAAVELAQVRRRMNLSTEHDTVLGEMIAEATAAIEKFLGYNLAYQHYSEKVPGTDSRWLLLSQLPVGTIFGITTTDGTTISSTAYTLADPDAGLVSNDTGWYWDTRWDVDITEDRVLGSEDNNYTVSYSAGWRLPGTSTGSTLVNSTASTFLSSTAIFDLPQTIRRAAILTVVEWFGVAGLEVTTTQFRIIRTEDYWLENMPDVRTQDIAEEELPAVVKSLLAPYVADPFI